MVAREDGIVVISHSEDRIPWKKKGCSKQPTYHTCQEMTLDFLKLLGIAHHSYGFFWVKLSKLL